MKGDADEKDKPSEISMDAVKSIMSNTFNCLLFRNQIEKQSQAKFPK